MYARPDRLASLNKAKSRHKRSHSGLPAKAGQWITHHIRTFSGWWFSELAALLPAPVWSLFLPRRQFVATLQPTAFVLLETSSNCERQLLRISSDECELAADFRDGLAEIRRRRPGVTLRLGSELGLRKLLKLPLAARNDLDQLLCFEMDRLSPFTAEKVHFAHRILRVIEKERCILVEVQIAPRMIVERALASCAYLGLQPKRLELAGSEVGEPLNLLPRHAMIGTSISRIDWILAVLALVFAGLTVFIPLQERRATAANLERQVVSEESKAQKSLELRQQLEVETSMLRSIIEFRKLTLINTRILAELTRLMPDDAHVVELHMRDGKIRMLGYAKSVSVIVDAIEGSPLLREPEFLSPITRDPQTDLDRFQILVHIRPKDD